MNENLKNSLNQIVKGLATAFLLIVALSAIYMLAAASGRVSASDDSTLRHFVFFLLHRPFLIAAMFGVMIWGYVIALKEEKKYNEGGLKRPKTKMENDFYKFWDKALSGKK